MCYWLLADTTTTGSIHHIRGRPDKCTEYLFTHWRARLLLDSYHLQKSKAVYSSIQSFQPLSNPKGSNASFEPFIPVLYSFALSAFLSYETYPILFTCSLSPCIPLLPLTWSYSSRSQPTPPLYSAALTFSLLHITVVYVLRLLAVHIPFPPTPALHLQPTIFHSNRAFPSIIPIRFLAVCFTPPHFLHFSSSSILILSPLLVFELEINLVVLVAGWHHQGNDQPIDFSLILPVSRIIKSPGGQLSDSPMLYHLCSYESSMLYFFCVMYVG